jgi:hypothetical protein
VVFPSSYRWVGIIVHSFQGGKEPFFFTGFQIYCCIVCRGCSLGYPELREQIAAVKSHLYRFRFVGVSPVNGPSFATAQQSYFRSKVMHKEVLLPSDGTTNFNNSHIYKKTRACFGCFLQPSSGSTDTESIRVYMELKFLTHYICLYICAPTRWL